MNKAFNDKNHKYRIWTIQETREKKVAKAVMVPLIISHDGAIHKDSVRRWKDIAPDIKVDWVRMAQNVIRYNVVIVRRFFNKGSWVSESWKKEHPEERNEEPDGPPERIREQRSEERSYTWTRFLRMPCVRPPGTPPPDGVRLTSAGRGNPNTEDERTNQPT